MTARGEVHADIRRWARAVSATHATIAGAGTEKRLSIQSCLNRIDKAYVSTAGFTTLAQNSEIRVRDSTGRTVAIVHSPQVRMAVGTLPDGKSEYAYRPAVVNPSGQVFGG